MLINKDFKSYLALLSFASYYYDQVFWKGIKLINKKKYMRTSIKMILNQSNNLLVYKHIDWLIKFQGSTSKENKACLISMLY